MASAIARTSNFPNDITLRGIHTICGLGYNEREQIGRSLFSVYDSTQFREHIQSYGGIGNFDEKSEGEAVNYTSISEGFLTTFTHTAFAKGLRVTHEQWNDDLYGVMDEGPEELGRSASATIETTLANHFNNGFDSDFTGGDGVEMFSTSHIRENGATYANTLSSQADLSTTSFEQGLIDFSNFRTGGGRRLALKPEKLLVGSDNRFNAARILDSSHRPEDDTNAVQPVGNLGIDLVAWHYLTDSDAWFILASESDHKLVFYERLPFTTSDVYDFDTGDIKFKGMYRMSSGWGDPRGIFGSQGV